MTTALAPTETQTSIEQLRFVARRRRELAAAAQDARENYEDHQTMVATLAARLTDEQDGAAERDLPPARERLKELSRIRTAAANALSTFDHDHPSDDEIREREAELVRQADNAERETARNAFRTNVRQRLDLLEQLRALELESEQMYALARQRWPHSASGQPAAGGISSELVRFLQAGFWSWNDKLDSSAGGRFGEIKTAIARWEPTLL